MPNKLTDAEVKKALEWHLNGENHCDGCPLVKIKNTTTYCVDVLMQEALDLINRQEGVNEKNENIIRIADKTIATLNAENEVLERRNTTLEKLAEHRKKAIFERVERNLELRKELKTANAENESLKAEVERLKRELNLVIENSLSTRFPHCVLCDDTAILTKNLEGYDKFIADIKAEAYKEFAERLREKTKWLFSSVSINNEIDNLLNELVSDGDGKRKD